MKEFVDNNEGWGWTTEESLEPHRFAVYALSYRKVLLKVTKGAPETKFIPAENRWKMSTATAEGESNDEYLIIEADIEDTDMEAEMSEGSRPKHGWNTCTVCGDSEPPDWD